MLTGHGTDWNAVQEGQLSHPNSKFIREVELCLQKNYGNTQFSMSDMAEQLNMSRAQLNRKLKTISGFNPSDMLRLYRLQRAVALMSDKSLSITEIAFACGFNDSSYFSKIFHKEYGKSPSDFRNERL
jgi:AraC-like DNA-binding protein